MVKTRSQDGDSKGKKLDVEDPMESRLSRLEDLFAERIKMMKQFTDMVKAFNRSTAGKIEFGDDQPPNGEFGESVEHPMVNLVPEAQEENPKSENHEGWEQMVILEVEGDVEKGQEVQSMEKICSAHQVFDKMSLGVQSKRRQIKCHKSWRFKFKQRKRQRGKPRIAHKLIYKGILLIDSENHLSSSMVKEIGIEISSDRWLSNSIGCELETGETVNDEYRVHSDSDLIMNDLENDKDRLKWKKRRKSLKSWRFKFKSRDLRGHNLSRVTVLLKHSLVITGSWRGFMMVKGYEQCHMLEHANIEAESFLLLNFAAEQLFLWMQNNYEPVLTVSKLERKKKKLCYKTWMFKYKAPLKGVQFLHYGDKEVPKKTNWAVQSIGDKDSHEVHITDANKQTEYTREGRRWLVSIYDWCIWSQLFILIDSGSTHNFMDSKIAEKLGCLVESAGLTRVSVVDGNKLGVKEKVDGFKCNFQSPPFEADVMLIPLGGGDMVLGVQWLETLGPITWGFKELEMSFMIGKQKVLLHGMKSGSVRGVKAQKLNKLQEDQVQIAMICVHEFSEEGEAEINSLEVNQQEISVPSEVNQLREQFHMVFEEPKDLPPFQQHHEHKIPLMDGANPVNQRLCRNSERSFVIDTLQFLKKINISQYRGTQEVIAVIRFLLGRHLYLNLDCEAPELAGRKRNHCCDWFEVQKNLVQQVLLEEDMKENDQKQQGDWGHYFLLFAAANWSSQMHLWSTSYRVWHRWKARDLLSGPMKLLRKQLGNFSLTYRSDFQHLNLEDKVLRRREI